MNYWLIKSEPTAFSFTDLENTKHEMWDGVRNYQARNNLREMKINDLVFFYHSQKEKAIVGLAKVVKEHYPDPTADNDKWLAVDFAAVERFEKPLTLKQIKIDERLENTALVKFSRLSVMPIKAEEFEIIIKKINE